MVWPDSNGSPPKTGMDAVASLRAGMSSSFRRLTTIAASTSLATSQSRISGTSSAISDIVTPLSHARASVPDRAESRLGRRPCLARSGSQRVMTRLGMSRPLSSVIAPLLTVIWLTA